MYQFFVQQRLMQGNEIRITGSDVNHIKNVLRMKPGDGLAVSNGEDGRQYRCQIERMEEKEIVCKLQSVQEDGPELPVKVFLFQGLPKADKMELIIQKAVELGVYEVIPVAAKRSVVKLDAKKAQAKNLRWQGIAEAAAKQSKRRIVPIVREVMSMREAIAYAQEMDVRLIPYELAEGMERTRELIESIREKQSVAVFIGPEGGFEETEIEAAGAAGIEPVTLGRRILRTETAGFTVLAWIAYWLEP